MKVYDAIIRQTAETLEGLPARVLEPGAPAPEGDRNELVLRREAAFELGEGSLPSVAFTAVTSDPALVERDEICLIGPDLGEIGGDCAFARAALIRTDEIDERGDEAAFAVIKNIELKKYAVSAKGYMVRASALTNREQVRVSRKALAAGLDFAAVGSLYIAKYRENPHVRAVKLLFITLPSASYAALDTLAGQADGVTRALNHALADVSMNCRTCEWKPVCDAVDGMKELHQRAAAQH